MALPHKTLAIRNARDFLYKLRWESERLEKLVNDGNEEFAYAFINAALTAWHMIDWAYNDLGPEGRAKFPEPWHFREYVRANCGYMILCREIADGSKHAVLTHRPDPHIGTVQIPVDVGISVGPDGWRPWYIETKHTMQEPKQIIRSCLDFWTSIITESMLAWGKVYEDG